MADKKLRRFLLLAIEHDAMMFSCVGNRLTITFRSAKALVDFLGMLSPDEIDQCDAYGTSVTIVVE